MNEVLRSSGHQMFEILYGLKWELFHLRSRDKRHGRRRRSLLFLFKKPFSNHILIKLSNPPPTNYLQGPVCPANGSPSSYRMLRHTCIYSMFGLKVPGNLLKKLNFYDSFGN